MKKIYYYLLLVFVLAGCSKGSNNPNPKSADSYTVVYTFSASSADTYHISYADQNYNWLDETFTGTTWSKSIVFPSLGPLTPAYMTVNSTTGNADNINVSIKVNGKTEKTGSYTLSKDNLAVQLYYYNAN
ncbi:MAG TPA: membrane lipoprotein lipid attachment site-containing protein [Mucilaginibacter sp.]|jgi:hypothetical protein|nr:membrane lipoprotein lipid attachment site-containing protein [Mucilaginibacter sp.]